jgi:hypothetical protein
MAPNAAQPDPYAPIRSMGLPNHRRPYFGIGATGATVDDAWCAGGQVFAGCRWGLVSPGIGLLGPGLEAYGGSGGGEPVWGGRAFLSSRELRDFTAGVDLSSRTAGPQLFLALEDPITRGGLFGCGASMRFEWVPARGHVGAALTVPLFQPNIGRTRPRVRQVEPIDVTAEGGGAAPALTRPPAGPNARRSPALHLKSQLFVSGEAMRRVLADPQWFQVVVDYIRLRAREVATDSTWAAGGTLSPDLLAPVDSTLYAAPDSARARDVFYVTAGSHNQDDRSLLLDGEVLCLLAGPESLATLIDFFAIAARSHWITTPEELDTYVPRQCRNRVKIARWRARCSERAGGDGRGRAGARTQGRFG